MDPVSERFWNFVTPGPPDVCWPWTGACFTNGYGAFCLRDGLTMPAHRFAWIDTFGPIPEGVVIQSCDNRRCCNPVHLRHRDRRRRGARRSTIPLASLPDFPEARAGRLPLSLSDRRHIRDALRLGAGQRALSRHFRVAIGTIQAIGRAAT